MAAHLIARGLPTSRVEHLIIKSAIFVATTSLRLLARPGPRPGTLQRKRKTRPRGMCAAGDDAAGVYGRIANGPCGYYVVLLREGEGG